MNKENELNISCFSRQDEFQKNMTKTRVCKQGFRGKIKMKRSLLVVGGTLTAMCDYCSSATKSLSFLWPTVMVEGGGLGGLG